MAETYEATHSFPVLERDLSVRKFRAADTRRIRNLFLEESRCLIWPSFVKTLRSPYSRLLQVCFLFGFMGITRSCALALFGAVCGASVTFAFVYRRFCFSLCSSLRGDHANISQYYMSKAKSNFLVAEFGGSIVGFIAVDQKSDRLAELRRISVDICFSSRRKKIAEQLLLEAVKFCQQCWATAKSCWISRRRFKKERGYAPESKK